ncbi:hypothetical protein [Psychrobacillus sp. OK032]|uniref:hypothetical protein n=1 Tax=Psychrobacillus sp. OK032 TaxID=1884358 RepID=UPI000B862D2F|nr:hypothetical protein [Psychrobacillus sp. OK032]
MLEATNTEEQIDLMKVNSSFVVHEDDLASNWYSDIGVYIDRKHVALGGGGPQGRVVQKFSFH